MNTTEFDIRNRSVRVTELLLVLHEDIDGLVERTVARIRTEVAGYHDIPLEVHLTDNVLNLRNLVIGLMRFTVPDQRSIDHAAFMGRQRALVDLPLEAAMSGYYVAYDAVWRELLKLADASPSMTIKDELIRYVTPLWTWIQTLSGAFTAAYQETENSLKATRSDMRSIVYETLRSDLVWDEHSLKAVESLGFDPNEPLTVFVTHPVEPEESTRIVSRLTQPSFLGEVVTTTPETVVISQSSNTSIVHEMLFSTDAIARVGIGQTSENVYVASKSYREAKGALACTSEHRQVAYFASVWPLVLLLENKALLSDILAEGIEIGATHGPLAQTVLSFANNRFSLTHTAKCEHLHPNTIRYRLDRWHELTGWDVYTASGMLSSLASLELVRSETTEPE